MAKLNLPEKKPSRVLEILRKEYPFERVLLGVLGILVVVLGVYILESQVLTIRLTDWWIFNTDLKITIFSWIVIVIGAVSFVMAIWPFFVPSISELRKKVTWPNQKTILNHSARVFGFIIVLSLFFVLVDWPLREIFDWLLRLGS